MSQPPRSPTQAFYHLHRGGHRINQPFTGPYPQPLSFVVGSDATIRGMIKTPTGDVPALYIPFGQSYVQPIPFTPVRENLVGIPVASSFKPARQLLLKNSGQESSPSQVKRKEPGSSGISEESSLKLSINDRELRMLCEESLSHIVEDMQTKKPKSKLARLLFEKLPEGDALVSFYPTFQRNPDCSQALSGWTGLCSRRGSFTSCATF
jgi:hypothetical protein